MTWQWAYLSVIQSVFGFGIWNILTHVDTMSWCALCDHVLDGWSQCLCYDHHVGSVVDDTDNSAVEFADPDQLCYVAKTNKLEWRHGHSLCLWGNCHHKHKIMRRDFYLLIFAPAFGFVEMTSVLSGFIIMLPLLCHETLLGSEFTSLMCIVSAPAAFVFWFLDHWGRWVS